MFWYELREKFHGNEESPAALLKLVMHQATEPNAHCIDDGDSFTGVRHRRVVGIVEDTSILHATEQFVVGKQGAYIRVSGFPLPLGS